MYRKISIQRDDFDVGREWSELRAALAGRVGAMAAFCGLVRDQYEENRVSNLELEHYPGMAEAEIERHVSEAGQRWPLLGVTVIHRYGRIVPGEDIVLVVTASSHRDKAFAAAEFLMDYLKTRAPFWKQVEKAGNKTWIDAKATDDAAAERWMAPRGHEAAE